MLCFVEPFKCFHEQTYSFKDGGKDDGSDDKDDNDDDNNDDDDNEEEGTYKSKNVLKKKHYLYIFIFC